MTTLEQVIPAVTSSPPAVTSPPLPRPRASIVSPLRYPGGKRRLAGYIAAALTLIESKPKLFVEPFAGGASVALQLLAEDRVDAIALADRDTWISSFWKAVFWDTDWLIQKTSDIAVTLRNWNRFRRLKPRSNREKAIACLFLNRTSFSGILAKTAGPIGGQKQDSAYTVDCRFPRQTLARRIKQASELRDKVLFVDSLSWEKTIRRVEGLGYKKGEVFYYLDPPFYTKAERLYRFYFEDADHQRLHQRLMTLMQPWLLSYDVSDAIRAKYSPNGGGPTLIDLLYSIRGNSGLTPSQELIITNLRMLPASTRLWRSSREWKGPQ